MKRILRREIFIEKEQIVFLAKSSDEKHRLCEICEDRQIMLSPLVIAEILKISSREVYRRIETENIHFYEDESFQLFVCPKSLAKSFQRKEKLLY